MIGFIMVITRTPEVDTIIFCRLVDIEETCQFNIIKIAFIVCIASGHRVLKTHLTTTYRILIVRIYIQVKLDSMIVVSCQSILMISSPLYIL